MRQKVMGLLAVVFLATVPTEPDFLYCIYPNWLEKSHEACKAQ